MTSGEVKVAAGTRSLFTTKCPGVSDRFQLPLQAPRPSGSPGHSGDGGRAFTASAQLVFSVTFLDIAPWPTAPGGSGPSLRLVGNDCADRSAACRTRGAVGGTTGPGRRRSLTSAVWGTMKSPCRRRGVTIHQQATSLVRGGGTVTVEGADAVGGMGVAGCIRGSHRPPSDDWMRMRPRSSSAGRARRRGTGDEPVAPLRKSVAERPKPRCAPGGGA